MTDSAAGFQLDGQPARESLGVLEGVAGDAGLGVASVDGDGLLGGRDLGEVGPGEVTAADGDASGVDGQGPSAGQQVEEVADHDGQGDDGEDGAEVRERA